MYWRRTTATMLSAATAELRTTKVRTAISRSHMLSRRLSTHSLEAVRDAQHGKRIDRIILRIATHTLVYHSSKVALVLQNIIELQIYDEVLCTKEALAYLYVPYQFVGIERRIVITSAAAHVHIGRQLCVPRQCYLHAATVSERPSVKIC